MSFWNEFPAHPIVWSSSTLPLWRCIWTRTNRKCFQCTAQRIISGKTGYSAKWSTLLLGTTSLPLEWMRGDDESEGEEANEPVCSSSNSSRPSATSTSGPLWPKESSCCCCRCGHRRIWSSPLAIILGRGPHAKLWYNESCVMSLVNYKTLPIPIPTWLRPPLKPVAHRSTEALLQRKCRRRLCVGLLLPGASAGPDGTQFSALIVTICLHFVTSHLTASERKKSARRTLRKGVTERGPSLTLFVQQRL